MSGDKAAAAALTLAVHGLFLLMVLVESSMPPRPLPPSRQPVSMWIHLPVPQPPEVPVPREEMPAVTQATARISRQPATAITLPPVADSPAPSTSEDAPPAVDWYAEAARVRGQREAEEEFRNKVIGAPVAKMREPCEVQESSMFPWTKEEIMKKENPDPPAHWSSMTGPPAGSVKIGGVRVGIIGGGVSIPLGKPEPNKHLFDDMMEGKSPPSSVPDPNVCD
jgi:hypothetical protein